MTKGERRPDRERTSPFSIGLALFIAGSQLTGILLAPIAAALDHVYCTPEVCPVLPQALTGWAFVVAPVPLYLWRRRVAVYTGVCLAGVMAMLLIAATVDAEGGGLWTLPLSYFAVGLVFLPLSVSIAQLAKPGWQAVVFAGQHWLLLAGAIFLLA